ncbi:FACT complex subunit SPT16 [Tieghemostelium lacteum]|uniref:FACT complex subunit n=1 Tax=Tieghemostelium lacteum TaxID=361077 RepID=A0A151ZEH5_TIELA|nr:FACT complex subunit SPT16 [Tieghemostelium lacteum]|eukprot:KYQ92358.1 FACT complex subunit SPT16 [Tieghemostelium lacteum]
MDTTAPVKSNFKFDSKTLYKRLNLLYDSWGNPDNEVYWKSPDSILLSLGSPDEDNPYQKTVSIQTWLFGYELRDTVVLFLKNEIIILSTPKKISLFEGLDKNENKYPEHKALGNIRLLTSNKTDQNKDNFEKLIEEAKKMGNNIGCMIKEKLFGEFGKAWDEQLTASGLNKVDSTVGFSSLLWVKDEQEKKYLAASALISDKVLKNHVLTKIVTIIDNEQTESHSKLAEYALEIYDTPEKISKKLSKDNVDFAYMPIIQSGGNYDLKLSANSNDDKLHFGTIIISLGSRYKEYCSNIARTYFIDPNSVQQKNYQILLGVQQAVINTLVAGVKIQTVYEKAVDYINQHNPDLLKYFLKNCGYGIGIEFQEAQLIINQANQKIVKPGMHFNLVIGFLNIPNENARDEQSKIYSMLISDIVVINAEGTPTTVLTKETGKGISDSFYFLGDEVQIVDPSLKLELPEEMKPLTSKRENKDKQKEEKLLAHQKMLAQKNKIEVENKVREMERKNGNGKNIQPEIDYTSLTQKLPNIYPNISSYPLNAVKNKIIVDGKKECVLLPIHGYIVPFHISTIKNASKYDEFIRINFNHPSGYSKEQIDAGLVPNFLMYIRECTFKIPDSNTLTNILKQIKDLRKSVTAKEAEDRDKRNLVTQEKLIMIRGKCPRISDIHSRPTLSGSRRTIGTLEAHENGLRFTPNTGKDKTPIDILYKNIRHSIFQPADMESMVIIHFHLHDALMIGKKKTKDVQFYNELSEMSQSLDSGGRSFNDEEEDEKRDRELKRKVNAEYKDFIKKIEAQAGLKVDVPYRDLGFYGVPYTSNVFIQPSLHCLSSVFETPFFVLSLDEIEIACFERLIRSLRNFDLVFIFKDYSKIPIRINTIPREHYEGIKEWLDSADIKFYTTEKNYAWKKVMENVRADIRKFHEDGGWSFLDPISGDEEEHDEDDDDDDYKSDSEDDYSSDYISSMSSGSESEDEYDDGSESEDDWETLAEKAEKEDTSHKRKREDLNKKPSTSSSSSSSSKSTSNGSSTKKTTTTTTTSSSKSSSSDKSKSSSSSDKKKPSSSDKDKEKSKSKSSSSDKSKSKSSSSDKKKSSSSDKDKSKSKSSSSDKKKSSSSDK